MPHVGLRSADGTDPILLRSVEVRQVRSLPVDVGRAAPRRGDNPGPLPVLADTPAVGAPTPHASLLLLMTLSSPLIALPLIGSLKSWYKPPQLLSPDRFDQPPSHLPIPEIELLAAWTSTSETIPPP